MLLPRYASRGEVLRLRIKRQNGEISIDFREIAEIEKVSPPSDFGSDGGALYITLFDNILDERGNGIELTVI